MTELPALSLSKNRWQLFPYRDYGRLARHPGARTAVENSSPECHVPQADFPGTDRLDAHLDYFRIADHSDLWDRDRRAH